MDEIEPATGDFEVDRLRHVRARAARLEEEYARMSWPLARLWALRDVRLRALLAFARARSPWHAERLRGIDLERIAGEDLGALPTMTKADLMAHWDDVVTDRRLTLASVERHLERIADGGRHGYLLEGCHAVASGGSSGRRTVMVWDFEGFLYHHLSYARVGLWHLRQGRRRRRDPKTVLAMIYATSPVHISAALGRCFATPNYRVHLLSATRPLAELVAELDALAPTNLASYPSLLRLLALEARAGRLRLRPRRISTNGEPLRPGTRALIESTFGTRVHQSWGTTETAPLAHDDGVHDEMVLAEDMTVIEPVDRANRPVPPGQRSAKVLVTNVVNRVLPLIRFEITDEVTLRPGHNPGPWSGRLVAAVHGRQDDWFHYGDAHIHPFVFRQVLGEHRAVAEYRVRQTRDGAAVEVRATGPLDRDALGRALETALGAAGLPSARVRVRVREGLARHPETGKLRRFVPLAGAGGDGNGDRGARR